MRFKINITIYIFVILISRKLYSEQDNKINPFDIIISEVLADPFPPIDLPESEYIEIFNRSGRSLIIKDFTLLVGTKSIQLPEINIFMNEYLILCPENKLSYFKIPAFCIGIPNFPSLKNSGQNISLVNNDNEVICFIIYEKSWYKDAFKAEGGWSIEIIDTNNPCGCFSNWIASNDNSGGTPGRINSVNSSNPDTDIPYLPRISFMNNYAIQLHFSEPMSLQTINDPSLYKILESELNISHLLPVPPDYSSINIHFTDSIKSGRYYTLEIGDGISDCSGNFTNRKNNLFFTKPFTAEPSDIIINEILFEAGSENSEFIEFYNRSDNCFDLIDLYISNSEPGTSVPYNLLPSSFLLFPGDYVVITKNKYKIIDNFSCPYPDRILNVLNHPALTNTGGDIYLFNRQELIIDKLSYSPDMHHPMIKNSAGVSLERISSEISSSNVSNWHSASVTTTYASPGYANTQAYYDISNSELTIFPEIFSPDNDGYNDVVGINYLFKTRGFSGSVYIYDSNGRLVRELLNNGLFGMKGSLIWNGKNMRGELCNSGIYIVFIKAFDQEGRTIQQKKCCVLAYKKY